MAEDELRMLIHLAVNTAQVEQKANARLDKLEQTVNVLHNNNATMSALFNDLLEQGRLDNALAERVLTLEAKILNLSNDLNNAFALVNHLNQANIQPEGTPDVAIDF